MVRRFATCLMLLCLACLCASAQGLNAQASKDDWEEINFEFNSAVLSDGFPSLLRLADLLSKHPGLHVKVEGHTDNLGASPYNDKLGLERANTVRDFLVKYGAKAEQVEVASRGSDVPEAHGFKQHYSKTDVARWMNRRVVLTVTDEQGHTVSAGGIPEAIKAVTPEQPPNTCCADILKRLDKLDEIAQMLKDLAAQNANLKQQVGDLQQKQSDLANQVNGAPKPPTPEQTANAVSKTIEEKKDKRFSLLGVNVGGDTYNKDFTFDIRGRYFAPFDEHYAFEAQGEYDYYSAWREGEIDFGLVNRLQNFQMGAFASFKEVNLENAQSGGALGQGSITADYIFSAGKIGLFATKSFLDNPLVNSSNLVFTTTDAEGNVINRTAPNVFLEEYLHVVDQAGVSATVALWGRNYFEGNIGYLRHSEPGPHIGGSGRLVFPIAHSLAFTVEGDANPTMLGGSSWGQILAGIQLGDIQRPKEYAQSNKPVPVNVPQIRWEQVTRTVHRGSAPPIADAGGNQIGVPAGTITLNGSRSYDPNGEALTYLWTVDAGGAVSLSAPTAAVTTFAAQAGASYAFTLTVTNTDGLSASAHVTVTTLQAPVGARVLYCTAQPLTVTLGQSTSLIWATTGATSVTITPGVGTVPTSGSTTVTPTQNTTYIVTATNVTGSNTCSIGVTVTQPSPTPAPQIVQFSANPGTVNAGQSATLTWEVNNATSVSISPAIGTVASNGSSSVTPAQTTTYTLTATNQSGSVTATSTVTVLQPTPVAPQILFCTAQPLTVPLGQPTSLIWATTGATSVTITPGVGTVPNSGSTSVTPTQNTSYVVTATNTAGSTTCSIGVTVTQPSPTPVPQIVQFSANPGTITAGQSSTLTWEVKGATSVSISPAIGTVASNGSSSVTPAQTTTYTLTATNQSGSVTATSTVTVTQATPQPPQILFCTAQPLTVPLGQSTTLLWATSGAASVTIAPIPGVVADSGSLSVTPTQTITYTVVATNAAGATNCSIGVTVTQPSPTPVPQIVQFSANPGTINAGQSSTLTWQVTGATSVSISPAIGTVAANGSSSVSPAQTTTYTLTATNQSGSVTASATVTVRTPLPPNVLFCSAQPLTVPLGQSTTLLWGTSGATSVAITPGVGTVANSGSVSVTPTQNTTYVVTATNTAGSSTCSIGVTVTQPGQNQGPVIAQFSANPGTINAGQSSTLTWQVTGATSISISPAIGTVAASGSTSVTPAQTTTYTLTATNAYGTVSASATVTVQTPMPPTVLFCSAQPLTVPLGQSTTLLWGTTGATSVAITPGVGTVANSGSVSVTPTQNTTYLVTATNTAGSSTCSIGVTVTQPGQNQGPVIAQFSANPSTINAGQSSTLTWQVNNATTVSISPAIGTVAASGNTGITPPQTTTYTLTASNQYGTVTASVTVVVIAAPPPLVPPVITSFTANPTSSPSPGSPVVLTCLATGAQPGGVFIGQVGVVDQNGNLTVNPQTTTTYICFAVNRVGQVTKSLTVQVGPAPPPPVSNVPVFNLPGGGTVDTVQTSYTINLSGTTSPDGAYPITYVTTPLGGDLVVNGTSASPTVNIIPIAGSNQVSITATDAKGRQSTATFTIYYIGPVNPTNP